MLSLRGAHQEGGGAILFHAMADDVELEEGEACSNDDDALVDPDVAVSYIDEKLQHVLGHFQRDFEGGVSAENLGPKFGGYGSFLPTYQRSPTPLPQSRRSSPMVANITTSRSLHQEPAESLDQNPSTVAMRSISQNNGTTAPSSDDLCKKEKIPSTSAEKDSAPGSDSLDSSFNGSDQKALKVRIRAGSSNALVEKKASIYSGLGLDISSSLSMGGSPDGLEGLSPEFSNMPNDSPRTILQTMTCFSVPGGFLLSPLHCNILQLANKVALSNKWGKRLDVENVTSTYEGHSEPALHGGRLRRQIFKEKKSESKKRKSINTNTGIIIDDTNTVTGEEPACQEIISDTDTPRILPCFTGIPTIELKAVNQFVQESTRNTCVSGPPYDHNKDDQLKEQIGGDKVATDKAEATKEVSAKHAESGSFEKSATGYQVKGKVRLKASKVDTCLEERDITDHRHSPFYTKKGSKVKPDRKIVNFESNEDKKDREVPCDDLKKAPGEENFASDKLGGDNYQIEVKSEISCVPSSDFIEDNDCTHSSVAVKDRKNDSQLKSNHFEKKVKLNSYKDLPIRSQVYKERDMLAHCELRQKEKMIDYKKEFDMSGVAKEDIAASIEHGKFPASEEQGLHMPSTSLITAKNVVPLSTPVVIEEWVCCDMCQKWRLLPYGTNPSMLPKKWKCSMLNWLPGMNRCEINEDETTDALDALYVTQVPATGVSYGGPHTTTTGDVCIAGSSTYNTSGQFEQSRKRKSTLKDGNDLVESSYLTSSSIPLMRNQQDLTKNKRSVDGEHYPFERDSASKHVLGPGNKSADYAVERQTLKHRSHNNYSDEVDPAEMSKKHGIDQDEHRTSKKTKKVDQHHFDGDWNHECDLTGGKVPDETRTFPAKDKNTKSSCEQGDICLHKEKVSSKYDSLKQTKKIDDDDAASGKENKEHREDMERLVLSGKNKTMEEREEIQHSAAHASKGENNENLNQRKPKIMKSEELMSKVDTRPVKVWDANTVLSCAKGCLNNELVADNKYVTGKEVPSKLWEDLPPRQALELAEHNRRPDESYIHTSTVATSSSSKISSSRRNKNSQEAKGSPVDSVSSSPLRNFNSEKLSRARMAGKGGSLNADSSAVNYGNKQPKVSIGKGKPQLCIDNQKMRKPIVAQVAHMQLKEGKSKVYSTPVKSDALKMKAQLRGSSVETGYQHDIMKQEISNNSDTASPIRKDSTMVALALKEARDLKHMANHLKNKGQELESTGLYFEAALKFLHVASLFETPGIDSSRPADAAQSMKMYSETAKLCDFCAHAYERCKGMSAAALAYKCVEVAYLKAAYFKHPSASKDRQELQAVIQIATGESSSSSASDVDNINSHGVSKAPSTKGRRSPQVAGNRLPVAVRNQAHLLRLLAYTNDVNCAFDATRKSQAAIASCAGNQEGGKGVDDGLRSVRRVLDLNFNNVSELLRLVRLSMESISS